MTEFRLEQIIPYPRSLVFATYRDRLPELVPYLPNCDRIIVLEREELVGDVVRLKNHWFANIKIPRAASKFVREELKSWYDHARWDPAGYTVDWEFELGVFTEAATCSGHNRFESEGDDRTRYVLTGRLDIDLSKLPVVPRMFRGLAPRVEQWLINGVQPNLESVGTAIGRFLDDEVRRGPR